MSSNEGQRRSNQGKRAPLKIARIQSDEIVLVLTRDRDWIAFMKAVMVAVIFTQMLTNEDFVHRRSISEHGRLQADDQSHDCEKKEADNFLNAGRKLTEHPDPPTHRDQREIFSS